MKGFSDELFFELNMIPIFSQMIWNLINIYQILSISNVHSKIMLNKIIVT